ncbi:MAG: transcription initiation factor IIB, partial [Desulfurococcaceae archaeon]
AFTPEEREKRSRTGGPLTPVMHDQGFMTSIDYVDRDASGKKLSPRRRYEARKLRKYQAKARMQISIERNLALAIDELEKLSEALNLSKAVKQRATEIYRRAIEKGMVRGRSTENVVAAAIYLASRELGVPRMLDEIAKHTNCSRKDIARCYRLLLRELNLKVSSVDPADFVPRIAHALGLGGAVMKEAIDIINTVRSLGITSGKDPAGLAAAAVYIAALKHGERRTQKEIAQVAGVTEVTVRNRYRELATVLGFREEEVV